MTKIAHGHLQLRALSQAEIEGVSGAATFNPNSQVSGSVDAAKRTEQAARLQQAYIRNNPFDYYGYFG